MNGETLCCRELTRLSKGASPFDRALVLGWYDGPTEGLVRCGACHRVYRFEMLDSEDDDRGIRVYRLAPLPADSLDLLVAALSPYRTPSWPMWVPLWKFPTEGAHTAVDRAVDDLMARADAPKFVVATRGLLDEVADVDSISASEIGIKVTEI